MKICHMPCMWGELITWWMFVIDYISIRLPLHDHLIKFGMTILRILFSACMVILCIWATVFSIETRLVDKGFSIRFL